MRRAAPALAASLIAAVLAAGTATPAAAQTPLRVAGNFSQNAKHVGVESAFFEGLAEQSGVAVAPSYNPMDVVGVQAADAFRMLRSGVFDVMSVQIGMASRDDPFFEGIDLIGVSTDMDQLQTVVDAYREAFDARLQERFNAKVLTLWPFGPQVFFCNAPIASLEDLRGLRIRSFTPSMSAMIEHFGATPVTLQFSEVYPALQRGVVSCGVTSPTSANSGNWPEVTTHLLPLAVSGSVQGHLINLDAWNRFSAEEQAQLTEAFAALEADLWALAREANGDAVECNIGADGCSDHKKFSMQLVELGEADQAAIKEVAETVVLPIWRDTCNAIDPQCSATWNATVGAAAGLSIE